MIDGGPRRAELEGLRVANPPEIIRVKDPDWLLINHWQAPPAAACEDQLAYFLLFSFFSFSISKEARQRSAMLITALRGFKVPVAILDRFLEANGVEPTYGYPPFYYNTTWDGESHHYHTELRDDGSKFLRAKADAAGGSPTNTRIFVPQAEGQPRSTYAYVAYAWVMVYAQRRLDLVEELPDRAPPGFAELRTEILGCADGGELETLQVKRLEEEGEDPTAALYVIQMYERSYPLGLYARKVSADSSSLFRRLRA
jgi:hypothetical protein